VSKPCSCAALQSSLPRLIMKQAMTRQSPCWIAKISAFGSTEPHRIHSTLVGYRNPAFLASPGCLYSVAPRTFGVCDISKMLHDRLLRRSSISDYVQFHVSYSCMYRTGKPSCQRGLQSSSCFLATVFLCFRSMVSYFVNCCL
jgi:hypothetical protein